MTRTVVVTLTLLCLLGCSPGEEKQPSDRSPAAARCQGGDVRLLQGIPHDLPGGGQAGFTGLEDGGDAVRLMISDLAPGEEAPGALGSGDSFTAAGADYRVSCLSPSVVTLDQVS